MSEILQPVRRELTDGEFEEKIRGAGLTYQEAHRLRKYYDLWYDKDAVPDGSDGVIAVWQKLQRRKPEQGANHH